MGNFIGDYLNKKIMDAVPGDAARKVSTALSDANARAAADKAKQKPATPASDGHTTSGLDRVMQTLADTLHPRK